MSPWDVPQEQPVSELRSLPRGSRKCQLSWFPSGSRQRMQEEETDRGLLRRREPASQEQCPAYGTSHCSAVASRRVGAAGSPCFPSF